MESTLLAAIVCGSLACAAGQVAAAPGRLTTGVQPVAFKPFAGRAQCRGTRGYADAFEGRRTYFWRPEWLRARKAELAADPAAAAALRKQADADLAKPLLSVRDKTAVPASGDKGDYYSIGPYWWPDPSKSDGLPYIRRDGQVNPERNNDTFDNVRLGQFTDRVARLALASYYLDDQRYARRAAELIRTWFLDPATRMNPNLNFGQAVPGRSTGRGEGLIEMPSVAKVIDAIGLIEPSGALSPTDLAGLRDWFGKFTTWMIDSPIGKDERGATNNHGLFYDFLLSDFSLFAGRVDVAADVAKAFPNRLAAQMDRSGALPEEIARTRSWNYSIFAMRAAVQMAGVAECVGTDLWNTRSGDSRGLALGLDFLLPYQAGAKPWPHPDLRLDDKENPPDRREIGSELYRIAAWGFNRSDFERAAGNSRPEWLSRLP